MQEFSRMAKKAGICEATSDKVPNNADDDSYDQVWYDLFRFKVSENSSAATEVKRVKKSDNAEIHSWTLFTYRN